MATTECANQGKRERILAPMQFYTYASLHLCIFALCILVSHREEGRALRESGKE